MSKIRETESSIIKGLRKGEKSLEKGVKNVAKATDNLYHDVKNSSFASKVEDVYDDAKDKIQDIRNDLT